MQCTNHEFQVDFQSISLAFGQHGPRGAANCGKPLSLDSVNWTPYQTSWDLCPGFTQHPIKDLVCLANTTALWFEVVLWGWQRVPATSCASGLPFV